MVIAIGMQGVKERLRMARGRVDPCDLGDPCLALLVVESGLGSGSVLRPFAWVT